MGQPRSGSQWIDVLSDMGLGLGSRRKELDKRRWIVKKYNDQKEVKSGAVAVKKFIVVLPTSDGLVVTGSRWKCQGLP